MDYLKPVFSVGSPGTDDYREKHARIFECAVTGEKKSTCKCEACVTRRREEAQRECER